MALGSLALSFDERVIADVLVPAVKYAALKRTQQMAPAHQQLFQGPWQTELINSWRRRKTILC